MNGINHYITQIWCKLSAFIHDDKGASGIEYAIIATIAAVALALFASGEDNVAARIEAIMQSVKDAMPSTVSD
nr:Flp family type IVb pilin [uncultured Vibrio sp.]